MALYGTVSDKTITNVRDNEPELYEKIVNNEPVNAQDCPLSCVWESNIPKEHDELQQYIIEECVYLYLDQLIEFGEHMDKETNIIFQLYGKRNDTISITLDEYFSALPINEIIDKIKAELDKQSSEKGA